MSGMDELTAFTAFAEAMLAEDEAAAREADATVLPGALPRGTHLAYGLERAGFGLAYQGFALVHDPARALRDAAAGRRVLERHRDCVPWGSGPCEHAGTTGQPPCPDMRDLLSRWSDRPGYRQEWALD